MLKKKQKHKDLAINQFRTTAHKERALKRDFYEYRDKYLNIEEITRTTNKSFDKGQLLAMLETLYLSGETNKSKLAKKLGVNYTVVQNLFKIMEGRLFYMLKHNDIDNLKQTSDHLCKYLTKCNKLIKSYQKSVNAIDKRLYDSNTSEFNTRLSDHERVNLLKAQAQINKYIHEVYQSMNAIYGLSEYLINNSEERKEYNFSDFKPSEFSFLPQEYYN